MIGEDNVWLKEVSSARKLSLVSTIFEITSIPLLVNSVLIISKSISSSSRQSILSVDMSVVFNKYQYFHFPPGKFNLSSLRYAYRAFRCG